MFQQVSLNPVQTQKQALDQLSLTLIKNTFLIGTYMILYIRNVFREEAFVLSRLEDLTVVELLPVNNETDAIIKILSKGVFDAVDKKYVRLVFFEIKDKNDNTLECYKFCFHYKSGEVCMQKLSSLADKKMQVERNPMNYKKSILKSQEMEVERIKLQLPEDSDIRRLSFLERLANRKAEREKEKEKEKEYANLKNKEMEQIYKKSLNKKSLTLLTSILNTKGHLNPLPEKAYIMVKMMYYDNTPSDYIPPYFSDLNQDIELQYEEQPMEYTLGEIKTGFHAMKINLQSVCFKSYAPYEPKPQTDFKKIKRHEHNDTNQEIIIDTHNKEYPEPLQKYKDIEKEIDVEGGKQIEKDILTQTQITLLQSKKCELKKRKHKKIKRKHTTLFQNKRLGRKKKRIRNKKIKKTHRKKQKEMNRPTGKSMENNNLVLMKEIKDVYHNKTKEKEINHLNKTNSREEKKKGLSQSKKKGKNFEKKKILDEREKIKQRRQENNEDKRNSMYEENEQNNKKLKKGQAEDSIYKVSNKGEEQKIVSRSQTRSFTKRASCTENLLEARSTSDEKTVSLDVLNQLQEQQASLSNRYIESSKNTKKVNETEEVIFIEEVKQRDPNINQSKRRKRKIGNSNKEIKNKGKTHNLLKRNTQKKLCTNNKLQIDDIEKKLPNVNNYVDPISVPETLQMEKKRKHINQLKEGNGSNNNKNTNDQNIECAINSICRMEVKEKDNSDEQDNVVVEKEEVQQQEASTSMSKRKDTIEEETNKELDNEEDDTTEKMKRIDADMYTLCLNSKYISKLNVCEELGIKKILVNPLIERMKKKGYLTGNYVKNKGYESTLYIPISKYHINNNKK